MKNIILPGLLLLSLQAFGQTTKDAVKAVQKLDSINRPASCSKCDANSDLTLYTPQEALRDIHAGKLTYLGRDLFPGNDQNRTCVYKSDKAYILYNNCMANKKESVATDIEVISFSGGIMSFYIQNKVGEIPLSTLPRSSYDMSWRVSVTPSPAVGAMTLSELKKFKEKHDATSGGCTIGSTFKAQDMSSTVYCFKGSESPEWKVYGEQFWKEPGEEWLKTKKYLRKVVVETKL